MAGKVIRLVAQRLLDFTDLGSTSEIAFVLAQGIDVSAWTDATLVVRLLEQTITATTGLIKIFAQPEGRTSDDPRVQFVSSLSLGTVTITTTSAPQVFLEPLGPNLGSAIRVVISGNKGSGSGSAGVLLNVDLSLKSY